MGFSPLEGLMMGQRCGNIDASIVPYMSERLGLSSKEIIKILNRVIKRSIKLRHRIYLHSILDLK